MLEAYLAARRARFPRHDLDHPSAPLFVDVHGRGLSVDQAKHLIELLYIRAGRRARVPAGALVHALRHTLATSALEAGADVVELQTFLGHAALDTTPGATSTPPPRAPPGDPRAPWPGGARRASGAKPS